MVKGKTIKRNADHMKTRGKREIQTDGEESMGGGLGHDWGRCDSKHFLKRGRSNEMCDCWRTIFLKLKGIENFIYRHIM